jgi:hypothetical protein
MREPVNQLLRHRTPIEALGRLHARRPGLRPRGFVFHASRCGSTLVAQLLAEARGSVVLSEAPPVDGVLGAGQTIAGVLGTGPSAAGVTDEQRAQWLMWMLSALGQPRVPGDRNLFVKFDAWHALDLPLIRRAFPDVPWVFVYRDPRQILASQLRQPGAFLIPGVVGGEPLHRALDGSQQTRALTRQPLQRTCAGNSIAERVARVLQAIFEAVRAALAGGRGLLVNYTQLPDAVPQDIARHFSLDLDDRDFAAIAERAQRDAKTPGLDYEPRDELDAAVSAEDAALVETLVMPGFEALESLRLTASR